MCSGAVESPVGEASGAQQQEHRGLKHKKHTHVELVAPVLKT